VLDVREEGWMTPRDTEGGMMPRRAAAAVAAAAMCWSSRRLETEVVWPGGRGW
jgi:hypothetical protein